MWAHIHSLAFTGPRVTKWKIAVLCVAVLYLDYIASGRYVNCSCVTCSFCVHTLGFVTDLNTDGRSHGSGGQ